MSALAGKSEAELVRLEREIARGHIDKFPYFAVAWAFTNLAVWLSLWPLVLMGVLPLWAGFLIASFNVAACYLPSHEAQHDIIAKPGTRLRWLNQLVGHLSTLPLVLPYRVAPDASGTPHACERSGAGPGSFHAGERPPARDMDQYPEPAAGRERRVQQLCRNAEADRAGGRTYCWMRRSTISSSTPS